MANLTIISEGIAREVNSVGSKADKPAKKEKVELTPVQAEIKALLDGRASILKTGLPPAAVATAMENIQASLVDAITRHGAPVARGNALFLVDGGELRVVDLTPKVLIRL